MADNQAFSNIVSSLSGNFKERYAPKLERLIPNGVQWKRDIKFVTREAQPGGNYNQPVLLKHEHGFTYAPSGTDAFNLSAAVRGATANAQVLGAQMVLKTLVGYEAAARGARSEQAFDQTFSIVIENMWASSNKRCEIDLLYGQKGIGKIGVVVTATGVITIATADWAPGIWAGLEGAKIKAWDTTAATATSKSTTLTISKVDMAAKQITVTGTTMTAMAADQFLFFDGQRTATAHNTMIGAHKILANTASALFGINAATYSLWASNQYAVSGALTFQKVQKAIAQGVGKGVDDDLVLYVNPSAWADLLSDEAALRRHVQGGREAAYAAGAEGITFFSQNGRVTIKSHVFMKEGIAMAIAASDWKRIGATDLTFNLPGRGDEFFRHVEDSAAVELRNYVNHAIFCKAPGKQILFTSITNST